MTLQLSETTSYIRENWPNLTKDNARTVSRFDPYYNCLAFVVGDNARRWWPIESEVIDVGLQGYYWPPDFPREESVENMIAMLRGRLGVEICGDDHLEPGCEKIAIYGISDEPRHFAKQLPNGKWVSKLGPLEDIEHDTVDALSGPLYGNVVVFLRRQRGDAKDKAKK